MKRPIKKIAQMIVSFFFITAVITACNDAGEEIFDNVDPQKELEIDEEVEKKEKPVKPQLSDNLLFFTPISKTYQTPSLS